ncbi:MscS Mechanosensitive ion channel [Thalassoporum mexicanum PCC 7367]|uniref:mechanosensitive ion channel family protein n=1 Tax=Thalassoporum mexicanum TaxID=3457544 RepID=UPI00029FFD51|nr:mechanosensitive ion channel family protein [Pseudanabaena sp. PCC 7367]AFY69123.1 MscS Mechanosensitive ion channel [Pseudanabaena sp. PCC 7367]
MKKRTLVLILLAFAVFGLTIAPSIIPSIAPSITTSIATDAGAYSSPARVIVQPSDQISDQISDRGLDPGQVKIAQLLESDNPNSTDNEAESDTITPIATSAIVRLGNQPIFEIKVAAGATTAADRAEIISDRIETLANDPLIPLGAIQVGDQGGVTVIFAGDVVLAQITEADAIAANTTVLELANQSANQINQAVASYRQTNNVGAIATEPGAGWATLPQLFQFINNRNLNIGTTQAILYAVIATFVFVIVRLIVGSFFGLIINRIDRQRSSQASGIRIREIEFFSADQLIDFVLDITKFIRFVANLGLFTIYLVFVFSLFPITQKLEAQFWQYLSLALNNGWKAFVDYIPNLFSIFLIGFVIYYILKFIRPIFRRLGDGSLTIDGFYPEFAQPTYRIIELLVLALTAIVIFPYLPGFGSPAFRAIALFLGALVSFGSTTAVANGVAGIILIYTRSFQIGDRIKIGNVTGNVEEKMLLVTRIRTFENTVVTIPNANLLSDNIVNYSATIRDHNTPVLLSTTITIGYDVPWRELEPVLVAAALATEHVRSEPRPFVLQLGLGDFSVSYELKVYTDRPTIMELIHSELHRNIQDQCNAAQIEILSPVYSAMRDGNKSTIPSEYLPDDYAEPGFNLHPLGNLFQIDLRMGKNRNGGQSDSSP